MTDDSFTPEVAELLKNYVYRLIDPRNGETFYVGLGVGDRVFHHARGQLDAQEDVANEKISRIRDIHRAGFEVGHVIHRHGMDRGAAVEVEAALIDAYPGLANRQRGHGSRESGVAHSKEIIERYTAPFAIFQHPIVVININRSADERDVYEAVRFAWVVSFNRVRKAEYVLAVTRGLIVGVFRPEEWLPAEPQHFPERPSRPGRYGFRGVEAPESIRDLYLRKRVPDELRPRGAANPIKYVGIR